MSPTQDGEAGIASVPSSAAAAPAPQSQHEETPLPIDPGPLRRLLVIDDQPQIRAYQRTARSLGVDVVFVERAQDALRTVLREHPDGIILDLRLPDGDGRDLLATFKSSPEIARIPVVVVSGDVRPFDESTCLDLGAIGVEQKPVALATVVAQAMGIASRY